MSDLKNYISPRKASDEEFRNGYEEGYKAFKIGVLLQSGNNCSYCGANENLGLDHIFLKNL